MSKTRSFKVTFTITATATVTQEDVEKSIKDYQKKVQRMRDLAAEGDEEAKKVLKVIEEITPHGLTEENFDEYFPRFVRANFRKEFRETREIDLNSKEWKGVQAEVKITAKGGTHE